MAELSRREVLTSLVAGAAGAGLGVGGTLAVQAAAPAVTPSTGEPVTVRGVAVAATGATQAGVARPSTPQPFGLVTILVLDDPSDLDWLREVGGAIVRVTGAATHPTDILPDGPGDLTVTVGVGPRVVSAVDPTLPGAEELPLFNGDEQIPEHRRGGDVLLAVYGSDPTVLGRVRDLLAALIPRATVAWSQQVFRGPGEGFVARNPLGFHDGVIVPHGAEELEDNVWVQEGVLVGGTVCVIRRLRLATEAFSALDVSAQEAVIGREKVSGAPLSGGDPDAQVDLLAKTATGEYLVPADSHSRRAHPSFTGSALMLRRGYAFDDGGDDAGLMFICFQRDLRTFVATQVRLDEGDALMKYATPTGSATFVILPGFDDGTPLGAALAGSGTN